MEAMPSISRAQFLRGDFGGEPGPIRPPWSLPEAEFIERCSRCGHCVGVCPEGVVQIGRGGFPFVDFSRGECRFCERCVQRCADAALRPGGAPWAMRVEVGKGCLAKLGISCRSCGDNCAVGALQFRLQPGGRALPVVDEQSCTGCGACYRPCPVGAIRLRATPVQSANTLEGA